MAKCIGCGADSSRLFGGLCVACLSVNAGKDEQKRLDDENLLEDVELNTPIGDDLMKVLRVGQGNFGSIQVNAEVPEKKESTNKLRVIRNEQYIGIVYRPDANERFAGTIDLTKIDGYIYGIEGDNIWYFNRLFVPAQIRNKGIALILMKELVNVLENDKIILICEVNAYGDLNEKELRQMYLKFGFRDTDKGYLIYRPGRD